MSLKKILLILLLIGFLVMGAVSAEVKTTVDGVDFILDDDITVTSEDNNMTSFKIEDKMTGYITATSEGDDLNSYIENDTGLGYSVIELETIDNDIKEYFFIDEDLGDGYFIAFQKDNKDFVYLIQNEGISSDDDINLMEELMDGFVSENKDIKSI